MRNARLKSRFLGEILVTSDMQMILTVESEDKLKRLVIKVKEESEKVGLKLSIRKTKIMASSPMKFSSVQLLSCVQLFATPLTVTCQTSLSITNSQSLFKHMSIESMMPSNHLILCHTLLFPPSLFPASGSFQMNQFFPLGGQSIGVSASASVLPMNIQD